jgi:hypothetical protein
MKFHQVEKIDLGSCTVSLWLWRGEKRGRILRPKKQEGGKIVTELLPQIGDVPAEEAVKRVVGLKERIPFPIVVFDPEQLWEREWGEIVPRRQLATQRLVFCSGGGNKESRPRWDLVSIPVRMPVGPDESDQHRLFKPAIGSGVPGVGFWPLFGVASREKDQPTRKGDRCTNEHRMYRRRPQRHQSN